MTRTDKYGLCDSFIHFILSRSVSILRISAAFLVPGVLAFGENPGVCVATKCAVPLAECEINTVCRTWEGCITGCTGTDLLKLEITLSLSIIC